VGDIESLRRGVVGEARRLEAGEVAGHFDRERRHRSSDAIDDGEGVAQIVAHDHPAGVEEGEPLGVLVDLEGARDLRRIRVGDVDLGDDVVRPLGHVDEFRRRIAGIDVDTIALRRAQGDVAEDRAISGPGGDIGDEEALITDAGDKSRVLSVLTATPEA